MKNKKRFFLSVFVFVLVIYSAVVCYAIIETDNYKISQESINKIIKIDKFEKHSVTVENKKNTQIGFRVSSEGNLSSYMTIDNENIVIDPRSSSQINLTFFGDSIGSFRGNLVLSGGINEKIPVEISIVDSLGTPVNALTLEVTPLSKRPYIGDTLQYKVDIQNLLMENKFDVTLYYSIDKIGDKTTYKINKTFLEEQETVAVDRAKTLIKEFYIPDFLRPGEYVINVKAEYLGLTSVSTSRFYVAEPFWDFLILGIFPVRWIIFGSIIISIAVVSYIIIRKRKQSKKRYKSDVDFKLLPKQGERSIFIGKIAETNVKAYFDLDQLSIHALVAGSTGGGKTVSAEVLVEEALKKNVGIIAFDPTAQWSGMLRKCTNKKMFNIYPEFGMKKADARSFNGNVHQILDARQIIDIKKYMVPGEIHVFATNKLDPSDMDILVANTIREVFNANLPESPELKTIIIFDEVHRLLPKFGGSGEGFIQIERGAREFRKWGVGLILISQVLTDFIGETKANINTEIQMRTRDEGDLNRIKNKYGGYMLQSLLKSATGTGMVENSAYNRGNPYFVSFRPLLHEHARLSDEELENYTKYNEIIEDLEYQVDQLEELEVDVFDLRLELKMALDKVKSGSFNMVDIYLEGLTPRIKSQWEKLGKTPKKRKVKLVSEEELKKEFEKAKKEREKLGGDGGGIGSAKKASKASMQLEKLKLKNGVTVTSIQELIDSINTMDDATFKQHVNEKENVFADWIEKADPNIAKRIKDSKTKEDVIANLEDALYG